MHMALKKNLDVTIHEAFLEEILQGNWKPGQALNLDELAERYGVSRTPIQQALKRMHTQGMVVFSSKGHFSVPTFSEKEVCDIIEMRLLLENNARVLYDESLIDPHRVKGRDPRTGTAGPV